jgi:uncharacterized membrane protein
MKHPFLRRTASVFLLSAFILIMNNSCQGPKSGAAGEAADVNEYAGQYAGIVPCADCEGIAYRIALNPDFTYRERLFYQGKSTEAIEGQGSFSIRADGVVVLDKEQKGMALFRKNEYGLLMLDIEGNEITGALADRYQLRPFMRGPAGAPQAEGGDQPAEGGGLLMKLLGEGIDFYARGNEPSWALDIDFDKVFRFSTMNGAALNTPPLSPVKAMDADVTRYEGETEAGKIVITLMAQECADNMSGQQFTYKVVVEHKAGNAAEFTRYEGCGRYVADPRLAARWELEQLAGTPLKKEDFMKELPGLEFDLVQNRLAGTDGCNRIMGGAGRWPTPLPSASWPPP